MEQENPNIVYYKYKRKQNDYDFMKTNYEWNFLDNIKLSKKFAIFQKNKKISLNLFGYKIKLFISPKGLDND